MNQVLAPFGWARAAAAARAPRRLLAALLAGTAMISIGCGGGGSGSGSGSSSIAAATIDASSSDSPAADAAYYGVPSTQLGAVVANGSVTFSYWNPVATSVAVNLYTNWNDALSAPAATVALTRGAGAVWSSTVSLPAQSYYVYNVGGTYVLDPYARSMAKWVHTSSASISGDSVGKGAILDPDAITPDGGWSTYGSTGGAYFDGSAMVGPDGVSAAPYAYAGNRDAIIYEAGVRDLTVDPLLTFPSGHTWGTFKALVDVLPHIQKLGVTHVQLLCPLENYYYDQTRNGERELSSAVTSGANYNWGYDPQNYFTPSGMYSADPGDPAARVNELKTLVNAIHQAGMGVILDVVYNHTANNSVLGDAVNPDYWYRSTSYNGAGSRDVATEHKMVRKLVVDSVSQWVNDYHVDGFRFDLMGVIDSQTLKAAYQAARAANPQALFLGEGWNGYYSGAATDYAGNATVGSSQANAAQLAGLQVGLFSDSYRNIFKNGYPSDGSPAFLTGSAQSFSGLVSNSSGWPTNFTAPASDNVVSYLTCHDNLCYYDVLSVATDSSAANDSVILERAKVGYAVLFTSQGSAFLQAGDEMFRSKETSAGTGAANSVSDGTRTYCSNSYNASDAINMVAWSKVYGADPVSAGFTNYALLQPGYQLYAYVQGLIALRKSSRAFRMTDSEQATGILGLAADAAGSSTLAFGYRLSASDGAYWVFHNADTVAHSFTVGTSLSGAVVLVDGASAGVTAISGSSTVSVDGTGLKVTVGALSSAVLQQTVS